jgi:hypothetical protein
MPHFQVESAISTIVVTGGIVNEIRGVGVRGMEFDANDAATREEV